DALARRLEPVRIDALYSSPLESCMETAAGLAGRGGLQAPALPHRAEGPPLAHVAELPAGDWQGRELKEVAKEKLWGVVQLHPSGARFPGGESLYQMQVRAVAAVERLRAAHP